MRMSTYYRYIIDFASINGKKIKKYAVNDIYIGNQMAYLTCFFSLQTPEHISEFFCSGVLACTGMGSNAWFRNAGGNPFAKNLNAFSYLVLHPQAKTPPARVSEIFVEITPLESKQTTILKSFRIRNPIFCYKPSKISFDTLAGGVLA